MYKRGGTVSGYPWTFKLYLLEGKRVYHLLSMHLTGGMVCGKARLEPI